MERLESVGKSWEILGNQVGKFPNTELKEEPEPEPKKSVGKSGKSGKFPRRFPKLDKAKEYLLEHPEVIDMSGRELEQVTKLGISYRTWNDAKKELGSGN